MYRLALVLGALLLTAAAAPVAPAGPATASEAEAQRILAAYQAGRPSDAELGVFRLDWAASLKAARERALKEKRPIFFVSTMQLKDAGDLRGGHC